MAELKKIKTTGFSISYAEYGDPNGFPILMQHGLIASIREGELFDILAGAGARVICMARPGYNESSPYELNNIGEWGVCVSDFARSLSLKRFDVLGSSSGAPYSYAIGYAMPQAVRNIYIFSGIPALYDDDVLFNWPYPGKKNASVDEMKKLAYELFFSNLRAEDQARNDIKDSMANGGFGIALDFRLRCMDWGFKLAEVKQQVFMRHARYDPVVPLAAVELTAAMLPNASLKVDETDIHFSQEILNIFFESEIIPRLPDRK